MKYKTRIRHGLSLLCTAALAAALLVPASAAEGERAQLQPNTFDIGLGHMGVIDTDDTLWMWGSNGNGQLGNGSQADDVMTFRASEVAPWKVNGITGRLPGTEGTVFDPLDDGGQTEQGQTAQQPQTPADPASFPDVKESDWFYPYVTELAGLGGISGFPDGTFRPGDDISRIEAYAIAVRLFPSDPGGGSAAAQEKAAQVAQNNGDFWANDKIAHALLNQISVFGMDAQAWSSTATREELSYLFYRAYDAWRTEQGLESLPSYVEAAALIGDYAEEVALSDYEPCILWLYTHGIVKGVNADGDFNPKGTASRAECCTMLVSLYHPEDWAQTDWDGVVASLQQPVSRLADGADFKGRTRMHYDQDVAYYYCRALEEEIGIQIFYLPEWTPKADGLIQYDAFNTITLDGHYFQLVLDELKKMKEAYDLYPEGFLKEMAQKKGSRAAEIILCPYTFEGVSSYGVHVYDYSDDAQKVDQIYYTGNGDSQYYSHEMGHMVMSSAAILNGWSKTCDTWESLSTSGMSYVSLYAMSSRAEDWAETWAYLWHQTDSVLLRCGDSGMKAKVQYLTQLLDQYTAVDISQLPWASALD